MRVCVHAVCTRPREQFRGSNLPYASSVAVILAVIDTYEPMRVQHCDVRCVTWRRRGLRACERPFRPSAGRLAIGTLDLWCAE